MKRAPTSVRFVLLLAAGFLAVAPISSPAQTMTALGETISVDFASQAPGAPYASPGSEAVYLHVSVSDRRITAYRGEVVLHHFPVGVGKGGTLQRLDGTEWEWTTPTGLFEVGRMKEDPVWYRPDWYYVENGLPIPPAGAEERYARGMLGDYALYISDEIAIHGTYDPSSVGRASSHGCLRMHNDDIAVLYDLVEIGTTVIVTS